MDDTLRAMLTGFVNDPPDSDFQSGFLSATLTIANEVAGMSRDDPLWANANALLNGDDPKYIAAAVKAKAKRQFSVINGGKANG